MAIEITHQTKTIIYQVSFLEKRLSEIN